MKKYLHSGDSFAGGICVDEMSIQEDLSFAKMDGKVKLIGFVDMGKDAVNLEILCRGSQEKRTRHKCVTVFISRNE